MVKAKRVLNLFFWLFIKYIYEGMCEEMEYNIGDIVKTKKQHPCGSKLWEITRVGVDFKLKCLGCGHTIMIERQKALKMIVKKSTAESS